MDKIYDPKTIAREIRDAKWKLFIRVAGAGCLWISAILLVMTLLELIATLPKLLGV